MSNPRGLRLIRGLVGNILLHRRGLRGHFVRLGLCRTILFNNLRRRINHNLFLMNFVLLLCPSVWGVFPFFPGALTLLPTVPHRDLLPGILKEEAPRVGLHRLSLLRTQV